MFCQHHTEAIKTDRIPLMEQGTKRQTIYYATEADMLNEIVFGTTAKQWKMMNSDKQGNMRDHATLHELHILANLEVLNAELIKLGMSLDDRKAQLHQAAQRHEVIIKDFKLLK